MQLNGKSELTLKLTLNLGSASEAKIYVAEVDKNGKLVKSSKEFGIRYPSGKCNGLLQSGPHRSTVDPAERSLRFRKSIETGEASRTKMTTTSVMSRAEAVIPQTEAVEARTAMYRPETRHRYFQM